ncbi:uncharacterized protein [Procambarus clarkii]|uniref:uncharacterized protein n=1 Tax=Procambarus clarkii TaxID=6728 RepID=UPI003744AD54
MRGLVLLVAACGTLLLLPGKQVDGADPTAAETAGGDTGFLLKASHQRARPLYYNIPQEAWEQRRTTSNTLRRSDHVFDQTEENVSPAGDHSARHRLTLRRQAPDTGTPVHPPRSAPKPPRRRNSATTRRRRQHQQEPRRGRYFTWRLSFPGSVASRSTYRSNSPRRSPDSLISVDRYRASWMQPPSHLRQFRVGHPEVTPEVCRILLSYLRLVRST